MEQSNVMVAKAKDPAMKPIEEREGDEQSYTTEKKEPDSDSDEDLGRTNEVIELENVSVKSKPSDKKPKGILSPEEVQKIKADQEQEEKE